MFWKYSIPCHYNNLFLLAILRKIYLNINLSFDYSNLYLKYTHYGCWFLQEDNYTKNHGVGLIKHLPHLPDGAGFSWWLVCY